MEDFQEDMHIKEASLLDDPNENGNTEGKEKIRENTQKNISIQVNFPHFSRSRS
jgi:hypothetical protein